MVKLSKYKNPDTRLLPAGWSQHYDERQNRWIYVNDNVLPKRTSYVHPLGPMSGDLSHSVEHSSVQPNNTRVNLAMDVGNQPSVRPMSTTGPSFAQQLYASSLKKSTSPAPAIHATSAPEGHGDETSRIVGPLRPQRSESIDLAAPAPPPIVLPAQNGYPTQLASYLANSVNPSNYSNPNERSSGSSRASTQRLDSPAPPVVAVAPPTSPAPIQTAPSGQSRAAMLYSSAITPQNTWPMASHPNGPRTSSHSSQPSSSNQAPHAISQQPAPNSHIKWSGPTSMPAQQNNNPASSSGNTHRVQSYQPPPTQSSAPSAVHPRSLTFSGGVPPNAAPVYTSGPLVTPPTQALVESRQHTSTHPSTSAQTMAASPPLSSTVTQPMSRRPAAQPHASGSHPSKSSSYSSPPTTYGAPSAAYSSPPTTYTTRPTQLASPHAQGRSGANPSPVNNQYSPTSYPSPPSTISSIPPTPGLVSSTSSPPPTPFYNSGPPTPQTSAPLRTSTGNQPNSQGRGFGTKTMFGLAGGAAAGILGGAVLSSMLGGDNETGDGGGMSGLIDGMGNMMGGGNDDSGGSFLDGVFTGGDGTDTGYADNAFEPLFDPTSQDDSSFTNPSNQDYPYYDPSSQDIGPYMDPVSGGDSYFPPSDQELNPYYPSESDNSGPDYTGQPDSYQLDDQQQQDQQQQDQQQQYNQQPQQQQYHHQQQQHQQNHKPTTPGYLHLAQQAFNNIHQGQQPQSHGQQHSGSSSTAYGHSGGMGGQHHTGPHPAKPYQVGPSLSSAKPHQAGRPTGISGSANQAHPHAQYSAQSSGQHRPHHLQATQNLHMGGQSAQSQSQPHQTHPQSHTAPHSRINNGPPVAQHNQVHSQATAQHGQNQYHGLAGQHPQSPHQQGFKVNASQVKQIAKGALIAGGLLAKLNGVNVGANI